MKSAVIVFPGSNCDRDAIDALNKVGSKVAKIWYQETSLPENLDLIVIPGGFSYGDYLRSGAMASISPIMQEVKRKASSGLHILGICNGFQILTESGLLPGVLVKNHKMKFICKNVTLKAENNSTNFTKNYQNGQLIEIPIAHMDGNYFAKDDVIKSLNDNNQVAFRYLNNPNGSIDNIAGIFNKNKNILGMMPHPERVIDKNTGGIDGLKMFESLLSEFS